MNRPTSDTFIRMGAGGMNAGKGDAVVASNQDEGVMSVAEFALFGQGKIAYIRKIKGSEVCDTHPEFSHDEAVYSVHSADGAPIMLSSSFEAAVSNVFGRGLMPQTLQ